MRVRARGPYRPGPCQDFMGDSHRLFSPPRRVVYTRTSLHPMLPDAPSRQGLSTMVIRENWFEDSSSTFQGPAPSLTKQP